MTLENSKPDRTDVFAGRLLIVTALLSLFAVLHHPVLTGVQGAVETAQAVHALAGMDRLVHGSLMLIFGAQAVGFYYFSARLGLRRPAVLAGFAAYAAGAILIAIPAVLDGFVTPDLAEACLAASSCDASQTAVIMLVAIAIQDFTKVSLAAMSIATLCWSIAVVGRRGILHRAVGLAGLVCGLAPLIVLTPLSGHLRPGNLAALLSAQLVWNLAAAALMLSRKS